MANLRDRILTPAGARAITSPGAIVAAGAVAAGAIAVGAVGAVAALVGAAAYAGVVAARLPRGIPRPEIRPHTLRDPWRRFVTEAIDADERFARAVGSARTGPLRNRLEDIGGHIGTGVEETWRIAQHGQALEDALRELEPLGEVQGRLQRAEDELQEGRGGDRHLTELVEALRSQIASTERIAKVARETRDRLRVLDARLDEAVARAVELSLRASDPSDVAGLGSDVASIVTEMESLRLALDETAGPTASASM
jgi:hypothetical protein